MTNLYQDIDWAIAQGPFAAASMLASLDAAREVNSQTAIDLAIAVSEAAFGMSDTAADATPDGIRSGVASVAAAMDRTPFDALGQGDFELPGFAGIMSTTAIAAIFESFAAVVSTTHIPDCGCPGCHSMRDDSFRDEDGVMAAGETTSDTTTSAAAAATLAEMAEYLHTGFFGRDVHFNLSDAGTYANSGALYYNVSGFTGINGMGDDTNGLTEERRELVREAFKVYGETLGVEFVETTSTGTEVDFYFADNNAGAYAGFYRASGGEIDYSYLNISASWSGSTSNYDDYTLQTIFHEIGHAMGLGHQGPYDGSASYGTDAIFEYDNWQASMMSYFSQTGNTAVTADYEFLQTPMSVDWIALQYKYGSQSLNGADFGVANAFSGDTVYGFNTNIASSVSDIWANFATYANRTASTIVDGGGIDTLDFSGYSAGSDINLSLTSANDGRPSISNIGGRIGNLTLAEGTVIENAIGGSGNDTFIGNLADNRFEGNGGDDTFTDSAGNDTYLGGLGADTINFVGNFSSYSFVIMGGFLQVINVAIDLADATIEWLSFDDQTVSFATAWGSAGAGNSAPDAVNDSFAIDEDAALSGMAVLSNDSDPEGTSLLITRVDGQSVSAGNTVALASGAQVTLNSNGTLTYVQNGAYDSLNVGQSAIENFTYTISDGTLTDQATVSITIDGTFDNQGPSAANDSVAVDEATAVSGNVLTNDSDSDGGSLSVTALNGGGGNVGQQILLASGALLILRADGTFDYDTNGAFAALATGEQAIDGFSYTISDGQGGTDTASVQIAIDGFSPPIVSEAIIIGFEGFATGSYLGQNGLDISGITVVSDPALDGTQHGATEAIGEVIISASGEDFDLNSLQMQSASGRVRVQISAYDDGVLVGSGTFNLRSNRITNATFDGTFDSVDRVELNGNGQFHLDNIVMVVRDAVGPGGNLGPSAENDQFAVAEGATLAEQNLLADNGFGQDSDPDGDSLTLISVAGDSDGTVTLASGAMVTFAADGSFAYTQNDAFAAMSDGETATEMFVYEISDGQGGTDTAMAQITVTGSGAPPPPPVSILIGFEDGLAEDGFVFADAILTNRADGVATGSNAAESTAEQITISRSDGGDFDFESGAFTAQVGKNVTMTVSGRMDGVIVTSETHRIRDNRETTISLNDAGFDNVDEVVLSASGGLIVDDLVFIV